MTTEGLLAEAREALARAREDRRYLHSHAEAGFELCRTKAYVKARLISIGCDVKECGRAGLTAVIGNPDRGKVILLRSDMDALPIPEESGEEFSCREGMMHACGHDLHTAMLLGAAEILKRHESALCGAVKLMFQPAEEILAGAADMIDGGVLDAPCVDAAVMLHTLTGLPLPCGTVIVSAPGVSAPAADFFTVTVSGKGGHGSVPSAGIDPLSAAAHILVALQEVHARELSVNERAVLTFGAVRGAVSPNVIPDQVELGGTLRSDREETREYLRRRLTEIAGHTAAAFRAEADVRFDSGCPTLRNDAALSSAAAQYMKELVGDGRVLSSDDMMRHTGTERTRQLSGSEDFSYISHAVPSVMLGLAAGRAEDGYSYPQHHPKVRYDENAMPFGIAAYAYFAFRWLEENR